MVKKFLAAVTSAGVIGILLFIFLVPLINNCYARQTEEELLRVPLPEKTELVDSLSKSGKLTGNGNGIQYFGAVLLKSELSLKELREYYSSYRKNEWSYIVEEQEGQSVEVIEHGTITFPEPVSENGYYIVYSWGDGPDFLKECDFRGH